MPRFRAAAAWHARLTTAVMHKCVCVCVSPSVFACLRVVGVACFMVCGAAHRDLDGNLLSGVLPSAIGSLTALMELCVVQRHTTRNHPGFRMLHRGPCDARIRMVMCGYACMSASFVCGSLRVTAHAVFRRLDNAHLAAAIRSASARVWICACKCVCVCLCVSVYTSVFAHLRW